MVGENGRDAIARIPGHEYLERAMHYTLGMVSNAYNFVYGSLIHLVGNSVDDQQVLRLGDPNKNGSTNPTHSQLAKDHDNHPFHTLAARLAKVAVSKGRTGDGPTTGRRSYRRPCSRCCFFYRSSTGYPGRMLS